MLSRTRDERPLRGELVTTNPQLPRRLAEFQMEELDKLTADAMTGHTLLTKWAQVLAGADPLLYDELHFFLKANQVAKVGVMADMLERFGGVR